MRGTKVSKEHKESKESKAIRELREIKETLAILERRAHREYKVFREKQGPKVRKGIQETTPSRTTSSTSQVATTR